MPIRLLLLLLTIAFAPGATPPAVPFIDAKAVKERFKEITAPEMAALRSKKILFASRSFGLNLYAGLTALAKADPRYQLLGSYQRYDVFKAGGKLSIIPADAFAKTTFVHFMASYWPHTTRCVEMDTLLRKPPHEFAKTVDAVVIFFHTAVPTAFDTYATTMDALRKDFPRIRFIYVTAGFQGPQRAAENENAHEFSEQVRKRYRGKVPVYDLGAILSDDFRAGHAFCPEYSKDPAGVHPDLPAGEEAMAKGFLLVLRDAFRLPAGAGDQLKELVTTTPPAEALPATHPDVTAVRAILDANGLKEKKVENVSVVRAGRIVRLYLQEGGITEIPDAIGTLTALEVLHCYADRKLPLPFLKSVSPALGKCVKLEDLLLNGNDLATLPSTVTALKKLKSLSVADNVLAGLPGDVAAWIKRYDPKGMDLQRTR